MRTLRLGRVLILSVVALMLWAGQKNTHAQYYQSCCRFDTMPDDCPSCCSKHSYIEKVIMDCAGPGTYSIGFQNLDCGTAPPGGCSGGVSCGTSSDPVPQQDASCQACANGPENPCMNNLDCCGGMYCEGADPDTGQAGTCQYD